MPDRNDNLDSWLTGRVEPLPPPPGTFDLIKRRARRRKYRRLAVTTATAAVVVAAAVTVPQVVNLPVLSPKPASGAAPGASTPRDADRRRHARSDRQHSHADADGAGAGARALETFGPPRSRSSAPRPAG